MLIFKVTREQDLFFLFCLLIKFKKDLWVTSSKTKKNTLTSEKEIVSQCKYENFTLTPEKQEYNLL